MSIEIFEEIYPKNNRLTSIIEKERPVGISPVASLARSFALKAGSGLRELLQRTNRDSSVGFALDPKSFADVPSEIVDNIIRHQVGVIYGVSIVELEHSLIEGYFDNLAWCSLYNMAIAGTRLSQMRAEEGKSIETLDADHLKKMREFSGENKTFSGFLTKKEGFALLPESLKTVFSQGPMLSVIQREVIPVFDPRAALLIPPKIVKPNAQL